MIPVGLHRIVKQLGIHRDIESAVGIGPTMLAGMGLPGFLAYGAYVGEIVAPLLVLAGLFTRPAALVRHLVAPLPGLPVALRQGGEGAAGPEGIPDVANGPLDASFFVSGPHLEVDLGAPFAE